jgi:hypothetical protein
MDKRKWWRAAAAVVVGGSATAGWFSFAQAEPPAKVEQAVWTRAAVPVEPSSAPIVPASASQPVATPLPAQTPPPPLAKPAPLPPKTSSDPVVLPEFRAVPVQSTPVIQSTPVKPVAAADNTPPATLPPFQPPPTTTVQKAEVKPESKPVEFKVPVLPPVSEPAPPAQPLNSAEPVKSLPPSSPDLDLRPAPSGNNFNPSGPVTVPKAPAPVSESVKAPAASVSRPKPIEGPMPATEKAVFAVPKKSPPKPDAVPAPAMINLIPVSPSVPVAAPPKAKPESVATAPVVPIPPVKPAEVSMPPSIKAPELPAIPTTLVKPLPPVKPELPAVPLLPAAPMMPEPAKPVLNTIPTPGVDPMISKQTALASLVGGALAFLPANTVSALPLPPKPLTPIPVLADPPAKTTEEKLADANKEIKRLSELLEGRRESDGARSTFDVGAVEEIKRLKDRVAQLSERVTALEKELAEAKKSTSLKPPANGGTPAPAAPTGKGTVRIENDYPVEVTIVVNNLSYRVAANTRLDIPVAAGEFTYQLLNAGMGLAPVKSPIGDKELVKLRVK